MTKKSDSEARAKLNRDYEKTFSRFVQGAGETALVEAYELGRRGLLMQLNLLEFALLHHRAVEEVSHGRAPVSWSEAAEFFSEALSPYELTLRAYHDSARLLGLGEAMSKKSADVERAHHQLRTILDATTASIYLRGDRNQFLFVNRRFEEVFGVKSKEILGSDGQDFLPKEIAHILLQSDERALSRGSPLEVEERLVLDGIDLVHLSLKVPLIDDEGAPYAVCSVATDISERKRAEEAIQKAKDQADEANHLLKATQAQLVQSAKMASLGELVAGIAHEINNPLAFILSHLSTVRRKLTQVEEELKHQVNLHDVGAWVTAEDRLNELDFGLQRIAQLVRQLKTFSRLDEGELKHVGVRESVESVLTILKHRLEDRIMVDVSIDSHDQLECYPGLLNQALLNLIANAIEAIEGEGTVAVSVTQSDGYYCLSVSDTGTGIAPEHQARIFEPFFTTKGVGEGTGLGLSITYSIMQKHKGTLKVECPQGGGTTMSLCFPRDRSTPRAK